LGDSGCGSVTRNGPARLRHHPAALAQMCQQRLDRELAAAGALENLRGRETPTVPVDPLAQPGPKGGEVPIADSRAEAKLAVGRLPQLPGDDVAQAVGREVAERAAGPVDVLEHAVAVVRNLHPEVLAVAGVPGCGKIGEREPVLEDLELEL